MPVRVGAGGGAAAGGMPASGGRGLVERPAVPQGLGQSLRLGWLRGSAVVRRTRGRVGRPGSVWVNRGGCRGRGCDWGYWEHQLWQIRRTEEAGGDGVIGRLPVGGNARCSEADCDAVAVERRPETVAFSFGAWLRRPATIARRPAVASASRQPWVELRRYGASRGWLGLPRMECGRWWCPSAGVRRWSGCCRRYRPALCARRLEGLGPRGDHGRRRFASNEREEHARGTS